VRALLLFVLFVATAALSALGGMYFGLTRTLPTLALPENLGTPESTLIYDSSSPPVLIAELSGLERRQVLSAQEIPQVMRDAVVAVEDERFYKHNGVDFWAIVRALWKNTVSGEIVQGGSTITQQLVKNAITGSGKTYDRKLHEAVLAYQLEKKWSKEKILNEYLNIVYFGEGAYGVEAAALTYFGVHAGELTLDQAALLAGLLRAPSAYSPRRDPQTALARRNLVLNKMYQQGYIASWQLQEALASPLRLAPPATQELRLPYWVELIREELVAKYGASLVLGGGLRVYTSVDLTLQHAAEEAVTEILNQENDPSAALVCVDVRTGRLVAMVGGQDFTGMQFNLATQARRQPGSAFKPFVLVAALKQGISPYATFDSGPVTIDLPSGPWEVASVEQGPLTLAEATALSSNGVFARLVMQVGPEAVAQAAYSLGITTSLGEKPNPAIALGGLAIGVSPLEMAMAYATLASGGERLTAATTFDPSRAGWPLTILRVTDSHGTVLDQNAVVRTRVLDPGLAALVTTCLEGVITHGTGTAADIGRPAAGKTGTTQNYADAWFVGYTPELVTAVWVGYPQGQIPMTRVHGLKVSGGTLPAQIWASFMRRALAQVPVSEFDTKAAKDWVSVEVCAESLLLPTEYCPSKIVRLFRQGEEPTTACQVHVPPRVVVPRVVGLSVEEAKSTLQGLGLVAVTRKDDTSTQPAGTVVAQTPGEGATVAPGSKVTLVVSTGVGRQVVVPQVVGLDVGAAKDALAAVGLTATETPVSDSSPAGTVLSQNPEAGASVARGTSVTLMVSTGPETTTTQTVVEPPG